MNNTIIKLYKSGILAEKAMAVDNISAYLGGLSGTTEIPNAMYQKIESTMSVKLKLSEDYTSKKPSWDYVSIQNCDESGLTFLHPFYFFIIGIRWIAVSTILLELKMDTINTFYSDIFTNLSNRTLVTRSHRDRFFQKQFSSEEMTVISKIDKYSEGISTNLFKKSQTKIVDVVDKDWFLIYETRKDLDIESLDNPVDCFVVPSSSVEISQGSGSGEITADSLEDGKVYYITETDNPSAYSVELNLSLGSQYPSQEYDYKFRAFQIYKSGSNVTIVAVDMSDNNSIVQLPNASIIMGWGAQTTASSIHVQGATILRKDNSPTQYSSYYLIRNPYQVQSMPIIHSGFNATIVSYDSIDKNYSRLMKVIKLPYAPFKVEINAQNKMVIPNGFIYTEGKLKVANPYTKTFLNNKIGNVDYTFTEFEKTISNGNRATHARYIKDSKLLHHDFCQKKVVYDSFAFDMPFNLLSENLSTPAEAPKIDLNFKPSANISSKSLFKAEIANTNYWKNLSAEDFGWLCLVSRNNEMPIFTNGFVDYIRNGYNYDLKTKAQSASVGILQSAIGFGGAVAGALTGNDFGVAQGISLAVGGVQKLISQIATANAQDASLEQKLSTLKNQATSVSGTDDLDLMTYYSDNRAWFMDYSVSSLMETALDDMFFYIGYACSCYEIPNVNSRYWFNFIACEPSFIFDSYGIWQEYRDDISQRLKDGITIFHVHGTAINLSQDKENYETWLMPN